jgi:hypothetical protein
MGWLSTNPNRPNQPQSTNLSSHNLPQPCGVTTSANGSNRCRIRGRFPSRLQNRGRQALIRNEFLEARRIFLDALDPDRPETVRSDARYELARLAETMIFSPLILTEDPLVGRHVVSAGETLVSIAQRFRVTDDLLAQINDLSNKHRLTSGLPLKVIHGPFNALIDRAEFRMDVMAGGVFFRSFRVGLGADGSTPAGRWIIRTKIANPSWTHPVTNQHYLADDPDNPIGEYWLGMEGVDGDAVGRQGFGIHGTIEPDSIGRETSLGCVRLAPADIEVVYKLLVSDASIVEIR